MSWADLVSRVAGAPLRVANIPAKVLDAAIRKVDHEPDSPLRAVGKGLSMPLDKLAEAVEEGVHDALDDE